MTLGLLAVAAALAVIGSADADPAVAVDATARGGGRR